jgi:UDP-N-acetylglucosamine 2-epimerase
MKKLKVMTVVGTRPEIIRLSAVINKLEESEAIDHTLVHTGQNYDYELNEVFFKDFKLKKPDYFLNAATGTAVETIGNILIKIDPVMEEVNPDAFLYWEIRIVVFVQLLLKEDIFPSFTWKQGIDALTKESQKKPIEK